MSIITKPTIQKGQENVLTLAKSELATQSKIVSDSYFNDQSNWKQVVLTYESTAGNQMKRVVFDASEATPEGVLELSDKAKNQFEVKSLTIFDFDGGYLKLERDELTVLEFDIVVGSVVSGTFVTWDIANGIGSDLQFMSVTADGDLVKTNGNQAWRNVIPALEFIPENSDGYLEVTYTNVAESQGSLLGFGTDLTSHYSSIIFNLSLTIVNVGLFRVNNANSPSDIVVVDNFWPYANDGDTYRLAREGSSINYYRNSVLIATQPDSTNGAKLYVAASFFAPDVIIRSVKIG